MRLAVFNTILFVALFCNQGCGNSKDEFVFNNKGLHSPLGIAVIPNENIALVVSTNFDFANSLEDPEANGGSLKAIDLSDNSLKNNTTVQIPNFGGLLAVDTLREQIFLSDRDTDSVRVFRYRIPGTDGRIIDLLFDKSLDVGEDPFALALVNPSATPTRKLYAANVQSGDLSVIDPDTLEVPDLNPKDKDSEALQLDKGALGSQSLSSQLIRPSRLARLKLDGLVAMTTSFPGLLFIIDSKSDTIEALVTIQILADAPVLNGIAIDSSRHAFIGSSTLQGILVLDLSGIQDNGIDSDTVPAPLITILSTGSEIEDVVLSESQNLLFAASYSTNRVLVFNTQSYVQVASLKVGKGPIEMDITADESKVLVTNFFSDSVSVIDTATLTVEASIK